jgi:hypothetical protein
MHAKRTIRILIRSGLLITFCLMSGRAIASAQRIDWDMRDAQEVTSPINSLSPQDQQGIVRRLREGLVNLRAMAVQTTTGHIFVVEGIGDRFCSGDGNCEFWILSSDYQVLLEKVAQSFRLQPTTHHRLPDILTSMHGSAFESSLSYWRMRGNRYVRVSCVDVLYADADGNSLKNPRISSRRCGTGG